MGRPAVAGAASIKEPPAQVQRGLGTGRN